MKIFLRLVLSISVSILLGCGKKEDAKALAQSAQMAQAEQAAKHQVEESLRQKRLESECRLGLDLAKRQYKELINDKPWEAARELRTCAHILKDNELFSMLESAEIRAYDLQINDGKSSIETRLMSIQSLSDDYPSSGKKYSAIKEKLENQLELEKKNEISRNEKLSKLAAKREAELLKSKGVKIGMTPEDVKASIWGKPRHINRTIDAYGVREQWVYDGGYLYFENGVLATIQN